MSEPPSSPALAVAKATLGRGRTKGPAATSLQTKRNILRIKPLDLSIPKLVRQRGGCPLGPCPTAARLTDEKDVKPRVLKESKQNDGFNVQGRSHICCVCVEHFDCESPGSVQCHCPQDPDKYGGGGLQFYCADCVEIDY